VLGHVRKPLHSPSISLRPHQSEKPKQAIFVIESSTIFQHQGPGFTLIHLGGVVADFGDFQDSCSVCMH